MSAPRELDDLREAFVEASAGEDDFAGCPDADRIYAAVAGELSPGETGEILDHVARHPACAEAWRLAKEIVAGEEGRVATRPPAWVKWRWAAVLVLAVAAAWWARTLVMPPEPVFRQGDEVVIETLIPDDRLLPRESFLLRWSAGPEGARYRVRVSDPDLETLDEARELETAEHLVPEEALAALPAGAEVFWLVEMTLADGSTVTSETFIARVE